MSSTSTSSDCAVCVETLNKSTRSPIVCPFCSYTCCKQCVETYVLSCRENAHCMNCRKQFSRFVMADLFTQSFLKGPYKNHHSQLLFDIERTYFPATQPVVEELKRKQIFNEQYMALRVEMLKIKERMKQLEEDYQINSMKREREPKILAHPCATNGCKGCVDANWHCGICDKTTCKKCRETQEEDHKCDPNTVETVRLLRTDTKPCPKCRTLIYKISGCDQMFCTRCQCVFSWKSGHVETGLIHNPHYYEWMRQTTGSVPRHPLDNPCQEQRLNQRNINRLPPAIREKTRNLIHIRQVTMISFNIQPDDEGLRAKFMMNEIGEDQFRKVVEMRDKRKTKNTEIYNILRTLTECGEDIILTGEKVEEQMQELISYINGRLQQVSKKLKCQEYKVCPDKWEFI